MANIVDPDQTALSVASDLGFTLIAEAVNLGPDVQS